MKMNSHVVFLTRWRCETIKILLVFGTQCTFSLLSLTRHYERLFVLTSLQRKKKKGKTSVACIANPMQRFFLEGVKLHMQVGNTQHALFSRAPQRKPQSCNSTMDLTGTSTTQNSSSNRRSSSRYDAQTENTHTHTHTHTVYLPGRCKTSSHSVGAPLGSWSPYSCLRKS